MNNVDKAIELADAYAHESWSELESRFETRLSLFAHLEAMEADRVRMLEAAKKVLETHSAEAKASLSLSTAVDNYSDHTPELDEYTEAAVASSKAEAALREAIAQSEAQS